MTFKALYSISELILAVLPLVLHCLSVPAL